MLRHVLRAITTRRQQPGRGFLILAALPLILFALGGLEYGGFAINALLASICLLQVIYPTLLGWMVIAATYGSGSAAYFYVAIRDLIVIARGDQPSLFLNSTDDTVFALFLAFLLIIDVVLVLCRPKPLVADLNRSF
jgi:hypothetical protein